MRTTALALALTVVSSLALAAGSGATSTGRSTTGQAPIVGLAVAGTLVAAAFDRSPTECAHVELWNVTSNRHLRLGRKALCQAPGGIRGPALVGKRVVWATNVGGNLRDWTVWTATTTSPEPKALATILGVDASAPDPVVVGRAGAGIVAYAVGTKVTALRANGSAAWKQTAPSPIRVLASGDAPGAPGVTAVIAADGTAAIVDASGTVVATGSSSGATDECVLKTGIVGQAPGAIFDTHTSPATLFPVQKQAKFLDCAAGIVIYRLGSTIRGIRLATGTIAALVVGPKKDLTVAAISPKGLAWAAGPTLHWRPAPAAFAPLG
jgi:hypothetical protein